MKVFILAMCLTVSGILQAHDLKAQDLSKTYISLQLKNSDLKSAFKKIETLTNYRFSYKSDDVSKYKNVNFTATNQSLEQILSALLKATDLSFEQVDKAIIIKKVPQNAAFENSVQQNAASLAAITLSGKVKDETGQPLAGVTVKIKGTTSATATDSKGSYSLIIPDDKTILVFSFIGYEPQEFTAKDIPTGSVITMKAIQTNLKEVVVSKGYYNTTKELNTGNVSKITSDIIEQQPVTDPLMALEGRVPGLYIYQGSGIPGANERVTLRGRNSIANGNDPLYLIDGVPFASTSTSSTYISGGSLGYPSSNTAGGMSPFNSLNPADIESIEVLKDADATTIYGSRGANGVILITTKKGKAGQSKVDFTISQGVGRIADQIKLMNTSQFLQMRHEALKNDGLTPGPTDYDINGTWDTTRYTNWQKLLIGGTAHLTNAQGSISGGNTNTQFLVGGGYTRQTTVFPGDYSDQKASLHFNLNHTSTDQKFHILFSASYVNDNSLLPSRDFTQDILHAPDAPPLYDANGNINWENNTFYNPLSYTLVTSKAVTENLISNANISYKILPGLQISSNLGYTHLQSNQTIQTPGTSLEPPYNNDPNSRTNTFSTQDIKTWIIEPQLNYIKNWGRSKLDVLIGTTFQQSQTNLIGQIATGFSSDALIPSVAAASTITVAGSNYLLYHYNAVFGRINYNWADKYLINLTARRDGSSRFGPDKQFGNFGAIGAGWIFSKEKFIEESLPFLSFGKLRGSYGITGNDQLPDYQYLSTYSPILGHPYQGVTGLSPTSLPNANFGWEVVKKLEGGLDLGFLKDRVLLNISYYRNETGNQLVGYSLPSIAGFTTIQANLPAVIQNTGIEFELNTINIKTKGFTWSTNFNLSIPKNKLISYPNLESSPYRNNYVIGQPLFIQKLFHGTGVDPQTGVYQYQTSSVDSKDPLYPNDLLPVFVGQKYFGGLQNSFSYKGFQLDVFFQFVKQTGYNYINLINSNLPPGTANQNLPTYFLNRWQKAGDKTNIGLFSTEYAADPNGYISISDYGVSDASFIRLKNVSLAYSLPLVWQRAMHVQNARIFLQGQNLFTITNYIGIDPETQSMSLPPLRMITIGVQLTL